MFHHPNIITIYILGSYFFSFYIFRMLNFIIIFHMFELIL